MEVPRKLGKYHLLSIIGQGSMGAVFKAEEETLHRLVAIKILPTEMIREDPRKVVRFEFEARSAARIFHPNVVTIYDVGKIGDIHFFAMQYVEGKDLGTLIQTKNLSLEDGLSIFWQMACALDHAHKKEVIHRDIKPSNVIVDKDGHATLLDFGIAKIKESPDLTREGYVVGSAPYMSPEQARGERCEAASDIFSLGTVMYEVFANRRAFNSTSKRTMILERQNLHRLPQKQLPTPLREINTSIPVYIEDLISRCIAGDTKKRFSTASELRLHIESCQLMLMAETTFYGQIPNIIYHRPPKINIQIFIGPAIMASLALLLGILGLIFEIW